VSSNPAPRGLDPIANRSEIADRLLKAQVGALLEY
jgi:hypothetical protein